VRPLEQQPFGRVVIADDGASGRDLIGEFDQQVLDQI
jgi:hypothetical protein